VTDARPGHAERDNSHATALVLPLAHACELAGALAELGVTSLTLASASGQARALASRHTDLPGVLAGLRPSDVLTAPGLCKVSVPKTEHDRVLIVSPGTASDRWTRLADRLLQLKGVNAR
jgi:hypothetical protein